MRIASPIPHDARDSAHLTALTIAEPVQHLPALVSFKQMPLACEHCSQVTLREASLREEIKRKHLTFDRILQDKAELLGIAVHDIRLPLATIQIYSELLAEGLSDKGSPELLDWINSIHSISEFGLRLLDETLDLAIAESGTAQFRPAPAILSDIVEKSVSMSFPLAARKQMRLTLVQDGTPQPVLLDPLKMRKVFNNLIENAIKYCQSGARITVRVSRDADSVRVSVQDDGPGIGPADLATLFTPFQRTLARARIFRRNPAPGWAFASPNASWTSIADGSG